MSDKTERAQRCGTMQHSNDQPRRSAAPVRVVSTRRRYRYPRGAVLALIAMLAATCWASGKLGRDSVFAKWIQHQLLKRST